MSKSNEELERELMDLKSRLTRQSDSHRQELTRLAERLYDMQATLSELRVEMSMVKTVLKGKQGGGKQAATAEKSTLSGKPSAAPESAR